MKSLPKFTILVSLSTFIFNNKKKKSPAENKLIQPLIRTEITIYAVLALMGAVILTLICLTIVVTRKFVSPSSQSENLPDVIQMSTPGQGRRHYKNPVTKVSRISKVVFPNRGAKKEPQRPKVINCKQTGRPPLPPPVNLLRKQTQKE